MPNAPFICVAQCKRRSSMPGVRSRICVEHVLQRREFNILRSFRERKEELAHVGGARLILQSCCRQHRFLGDVVARCWCWFVRCGTSQSRAKSNAMSASSAQRAHCSEIPTGEQRVGRLLSADTRRRNSKFQAASYVSSRPAPGHQLCSVHIQMRWKASPTRSNATPIHCPRKRDESNPPGSGRADGRTGGRRLKRLVAATMP